MRRLTKAFFPIVGLSFVMACSGASSGAESGVTGLELSLESASATVEEGALTGLHSCEEVHEAARAAAARAMQELLDKNLKRDVAAVRRGSCWGGTFGPAVPSGENFDFAPLAQSGEPANVSETNNQVAGVDEADFVKNDNRYIYLLKDDELVIIEAWPPQDAQIVSTTSLTGDPKRLFVEGDRLLVYASVRKPWDERYPFWYQIMGECTYGYDCEFTGDGQGTRLTVYDIRDRRSPRRVRTIDTSASFLSARRMGSAVHTVLYGEPELLRGLPILPPELQEPELCSGRRWQTSEDGWGRAYQRAVPTEADIERVYAAYERLQEANLRAIEEAPIETLLNPVGDEIAVGEGGQPAQGSCERFYDAPLRDGTAFLQLMSFDLQADSAIETSTIVSRPGAGYATADAYYVAVSQQPMYGFWFPSLRGVREASTVHKFDLMEDGNSYAASGVVKGRVLNQFAMDQHEGYLRIATTSGYVPDPEVHSTLSTLRQEGNKLVVAGQVDDIAPTEDIRSVRFLEDRAYVVTFKKTDPLFAFDLSDPEHPKTLGELKIPGFSTYMHPLQDGYLMSIGYDADDQGEFAWFTGLMLQMFDVSDPGYPVLTHKEVIGTRGSTSEAVTNHLAFSYFAPKHTLALPVTVCEGGEDGSYGTDMTFSGVMFYDVDIDSGFSLMGTSSHPYSSSSSFIGNACRNWWTTSNSVVKRTVFMDDFVYSISDVRIKVSDIRDLRDDVAVVSLQ